MQEYHQICMKMVCCTMFYQMRNIFTLCMAFILLVSGLICIAQTSQIQALCCLQGWLRCHQLYSDRYIQTAYTLVNMVQIFHDSSTFTITGTSRPSLDLGTRTYGCRYGASNSFAFPPLCICTPLLAVSKWLTASLCLCLSVCLAPYHHFENFIDL